MKTRRAALCPLLLLLGMTGAEAVPITIQVDYAPPTSADLICFGIDPAACVLDPSLVASIQTVSLLFDIDDAQRAANGSYDVSATLRGAALDTIAALNPTTFTHTATAVAHGGLVTDVLLAVHYLADISGTLVDQTFSAGAGTYSNVAISYVPLFGIGSTLSYLGSYSIFQEPAPPGPGPVTSVPEPATWLLVGTALVALGGRRRTDRSRPVAP